MPKHEWPEAQVDLPEGSPAIGQLERCPAIGGQLWNNSTSSWPLNP